MANSTWSFHSNLSQVPTKYCDHTWPIFQWSPSLPPHTSQNQHGSIFDIVMGTHILPHQSINLLWVIDVCRRTEISDSLVKQMPPIPHANHIYYSRNRKQRAFISYTHSFMLLLQRQCIDKYYKQLHRTRNLCAKRYIMLNCGQSNYRASGRIGPIPSENSQLRYLL